MSTSSTVCRWGVAVVAACSLGLNLTASRVQAATPVYVSAAMADDSGDGLTPGTAKKYIGSGIAIVDAGGTVNVAAGLYKESNILLDKSLSVQGVGATRDDVVIAPAAEDGNTDFAFANSAQNGFAINAHDVTIKNLTINGRGNPALTPDKNNFRAGIVTVDASQAGGGAWNNLHVDNVFVKYAYRRGISVFPATVSGTVVENSRVDNTAFNHGMYLAGQSHAISNTINHCFQGIVQALDSSTPAGLIKTTGNTLSEIGNFPGCWGDQGAGANPRYQGQPRAIQFNNSDAAGRTVEIKDNVIDDNGSAGLAGAVGIYTRLANADSIVENNNISLTSGASFAVDGGIQSVGMLLGWSYANGFTARNNYMRTSGYGMGVMIFGAGTAAKPMVLEGNTIVGTNSTRDAQGDGTGIYIANQYLFGSDKNESYVILQCNNAISGFVRGIDVEKVVTSTQPLTVTAHGNSIAGNTTGIDASTLSVAMDATYNYWGATDGPGTVGLGSGDKVSANVIYNPWCNTDTKTTKSYQVGAGETYATIQAAIDAASAGDTINVAAGTYTEQILIQKSLSLIGAGRSTTTIRAPATRTGVVTNGATVHDYLLAAYAANSTIDVRVEASRSTPTDRTRRRARRGWTGYSSGM